MTLSLYSTYKAWKRENAREREMQAQSEAASAATGRGPSAVYAALAAMGCGLGGMACADGIEAHKP
ncbi:MAG: hypothetical protein AB1831_01660 [Pseudomonadota bacterium]